MQININIYLHTNKFIFINLQILKYSEKPAYKITSG